MKIEHLISWTVLTSACVPAQHLELPEPPPGTKAIILSMEDPQCDSGTCAFARAYPGTNIDQALTIPLDAPALYALYYQDDLQALDIAAGPLDACAQTKAPACFARGERFLPRPEHTYGAPISAGALAPFRELAGLPELLDHLRIPAIDPLGCAQSSPPRCFSSRGAIRDDSEESARALRCIECLNDVVPVEPRGPELAVDVEPITFVPCPVGWSVRSLTEEGLFSPSVTACEPKDDARATCPRGQVQLPGAPECTTIGDPCPASGPFPPNPPIGAVFVRAGATGGDGSMSSPLGTLEEALSRTATIVVAPGRYELCEDPGRVIIGACTSGVIIGDNACPGSLFVLHDGSALRDLTVEGGVQLVDRATATLSRVVVSGIRGGSCLAGGSGSILRGDSVAAYGCDNALLVHGSTVTLDAVALEGDVLGAALEFGASVDLSRAVIKGSTLAVVSRRSSVQLSDAYLETGEHGIILDGGVAQLYDVSLHGNPRRNTRLLQAVGGAHVVVERGVFASVGEVAIEIHGVGGTRAVLSDVVIRDVSPAPALGWGLYISAGADVGVARMRIERAAHGGVFSADSRLEARGLIVVPGTLTPMVGVEVASSTVVLSEVAIRGTKAQALFATHSNINVTSAVIDSAAQGFFAANHTTMIARRLDLQHIDPHGIVQDVTSTGMYFDVRMRDVVLGVFGEGSVQLEHASFERCDAVTFLQSALANTILRDLEVVDCGSMGPVIKTFGGSLDLERVSISGAMQGAIYAGNVDAVTLSDVALLAEGATQTAVRITGGNATITKTKIVGGGTLLELCGVQAAITDVFLDSGTTGIVADGSMVDLASFRMPRVNTGINVQTVCRREGVHLGASRGVIEASIVGLRLPKAEEKSVPDALYEVRYSAPVPIELYEPEDQ